MNTPDIPNQTPRADEQLAREALTEGVIIEGGEIKDDSREIEFHEKRHRALTARLLAITLTWMLASSWLIHYAVTAYFIYQEKAQATEELGRIFNVWLPVLAGLVGAATAYYFTKENRQ